MSRSDIEAKSFDDRARARRGGGMHESFGLLQVQRLRHAAPLRMLKAESVEYVALAADGAPGPPANRLFSVWRDGSKFMHSPGGGK
jgi:hypothetical protein